MNKRQREQVLKLSMVEPGGLRIHGLGAKHRGAITHAFFKHMLAYRHRLQRGWWTPMNKEQYFAKGTMFEYRAHWWAGNEIFLALCKDLSNSNFPPIQLILSTTSHVHTKAIRESLQNSVVKPHEIIFISGNHDKICQPPSLSRLYSEAIG